jgi:hypothetical protein
MAETQRKAAKDKQDAQLAQAKMQDGQQRGQADMAAKAQENQQKIQAQLQIAHENNATSVEIENARMQHELINQPAAMPPEGAPNGNV